MLRNYVGRGTAGVCFGVESAVGAALVKFEDPAVFSVAAVMFIEVPFDAPDARAAFSLAILSRSIFLASVSALVYLLRGAAALGFLISVVSFIPLVAAPLASAVSSAFLSLSSVLTLEVLEAADLVAAGLEGRALFFGAADPSALSNQVSK